MKQYNKQKAISITDQKVPMFLKTLSVLEARQKLSDEIGSFSSINYIYIIDNKNIFQGVLSIKELLQSPPEKILSELIQGQKKATVQEDDDQEEVVLLALKNNIKAVPVVNKKNVLVGAVPSDEILRILNEENIEDHLIFAGFNTTENPSSDLKEIGIFFHFRKRFPWLLFGLLGGIFAAIIVNYFEDVFKQELILASFIPAIVYMADAVGGQAQMIFIKSSAIGDSSQIKRYLKREVRVNLLLALILAIVIYWVSFWWIKSLVISIILALSIFLTVLFSMLIAISIPWVLQKRGYDPAVASGPMATVIRDIASLIIFFLVASLILFI